MREEGERAKEEAGEASAAAASQPAASPRQDAEPEELPAFFDYSSIRQRKLSPAVRPAPSWNPASGV